MFDFENRSTDDGHDKRAVALLIESINPHQETVGYSGGVRSDEVIVTAARVNHICHISYMSLLLLRAFIMYTTKHVHFWLFCFVFLWAAECLLCTYVKNHV